jgi:hypothetical protein
MDCWVAAALPSTATVAALSAGPMAMSKHSAPKATRPRREQNLFRTGAVHSRFFELKWPMERSKKG